MDLNASDLLEPDIDEQIPTSLSSRLLLISPCSKSSVATSDLLQVESYIESCSEVVESRITTNEEAELYSTFFDNDFGTLHPYSLFK